jgi:hypothetical protein
VERKPVETKPAAPKVPTFASADMGTLDEWHEANRDNLAALSAAEKSNAAKRAGFLLLEMVKGAPDSREDINERWGHWFQFMHEQCPDIWDRFGAKWSELTGTTTQKAAE